MLNNQSIFYQYDPPSVYGHPLAEKHSSCPLEEVGVRNMRRLPGLKIFAKKKVQKREKAAPLL